MTVAALSYRIPAEGWKPEGWTPPSKDESHAKMITTRHVDIDQALRTPQFYQLWVMLCFNVTAGIGVLGVAKTMMRDIFGTGLPGVVDGAFAATYVLMISVFNMVGRFFWASMSDYIGRRATYSVFFILGAMLYCSIPYIAQEAGVNPAGILAGGVLRCHHDHIHHVWRRLCHHPGLSGGYVRHQVRGWHPWPLAHRLEHRWLAGSPCHNMVAPRNHGWWP